MSDRTRYRAYQESRFREFEALCRRCGACCGIRDGDPCVRLKKTGEGRHSCSVYRSRLGPQQTVSGRPFTCIPIQELAKRGEVPGTCAYRTRGGHYLSLAQERCSTYNLSEGLP